MAALWLLCTALRAQSVDFSVEAPQTIETGRMFRVEFAANAEVDEFTPPEFAGMTVLAGPSTSRGTSISMVGGKQTRSVTHSFTYVLSIKEPGEVVIPPAEIRVGEERYRSRPVKITAFLPPIPI